MDIPDASSNCPPSRMVLVGDLLSRAPQASDPKTKAATAGRMRTLAPLALTWSASDAARGRKKTLTMETPAPIERMLTSTMLRERRTLGLRAGEGELDSTRYRSGSSAVARAR